MYQKKITSYHLLVYNMDLHQDEMIQMKKIEIYLKFCISI